MENGLSLTRKPLEQLILKFEDSNGETTEIIQTITKISGNKVRLSTKAPSNVRITRRELLSD
jgi:sRNA-binding carbon storage regulator CsrA